MIKAKGYNNMKKSGMIRLLAGISAAALMASSFTGCDRGKTPESGSEPSSPASPSVTEKTEERTQDISAVNVGSGHDFEIVKSVQPCGDSIYVFEQMNGSFQKETSVLAYFDTKKTSEISLEAMEYGYIQSVAAGKNNLGFVYNDEFNMQQIAAIDYETGEVKARAEIPEENYTLVAFRNDGFGHYTVLKTVYDDGGPTAFFEVYDEDTLKLVNSVNFTEKLSLDDEMGILDAMADSDGSVYVTAVRYSMDLNMKSYLYKTDRDGNLIFRREDFTEKDGFFAGMYFSEKGKMCLGMTSDYSEFFVHEIDSETGTSSAVHNIKTPGFINYISTLNVPGYDFTYISSSGIRGCRFDSDKTDVVMNFGVDLDSALKESFAAASDGNRFFMYSVTAAESATTVTAFDANGNEKLNAELQTTLGYTSEYCTSPDGTIVYSETYDPGAESETESKINNAYIFHVLNADGTPKSSFKIDELNTMGESVIQKMRFDKDGNIYMLFQTFRKNTLDTLVYVTDKNGNIKSKAEGGKQSVYITELLVSEKASRAVCMDENGETIIMSLDAESGKLSEEFRLTLEDDAYFVEGSGKYDLCYRIGETVMGYSAAEQKSYEIMNLAGTADGAGEIFVESDNKIICSAYDSETGETVIKVLTAE